MYPQKYPQRVTGEQMDAQSMGQAGEAAESDKTAEAAGQIGAGLADDLFDTQALLEALESRLQRLMDSEALDEHAGDTLARLVRLAAARVGAAAETGMNLRHTLDATRRAAPAGGQA